MCRKICYVTTISLTVKAFFLPQLYYLSQNGYQVYVVSSRDEELKRQLGDSVKYFPIEIPRGISIFRSLIAIYQLTRFFNKEKFDLVQYSTPNASLYASIAARFVRIPIRNYHLMGFRYMGATGIGKNILKYFEKITCENSTSIECVSKSNLELGVADGIFPREKATVIWNGSTGGVDFTKFDITYRECYREEIRTKYHIKKDTFVYGFVGRITKDKGIDEILEAFEKIKNAKLMMIGQEERSEMLEQRRYNESIKNSNIIYTGSVDEVEKYYCAMDVLLLPSYREGFGNVVIEAAAMGTPAIISNIPGPVDAVEENKTALVVTAQNAQELYQAMLNIQKISTEKMGREAYGYVKNRFDSAILCEEILRRKEMLLKKYLNNESQ